jgi:hypothetical protein
MHTRFLQGFNIATIHHFQSGVYKQDFKHMVEANIFVVFLLFKRYKQNVENWFG